jgi:hypothetical protein
MLAAQHLNLPHGYGDSRGIKVRELGIEQEVSDGLAPSRRAVETPTPAWANRSAWWWPTHRVGRRSASTEMKQRRPWVACGGDVHDQLCGCMLVS